MGLTTGQTKAIRHVLRTQAGYQLTTGLHDGIRFVESNRAELLAYVALHNAPAAGLEPILTFSVAKDFTRTPGARFLHEHGEPGFSAEELVPKLAHLLRNCTVPVPGFVRPVALLLDLDGTAGYAASFIDEVFTQLVLREEFSAQELREYLIVLSTEEDYLVEDIFDTIQAAEAAQARIF